MCFGELYWQQTHFLLKAYGFPAEHIVLLVQYVLFSRSEEAWQDTPWNYQVKCGACLSVCASQSVLDNRKL